MSEQVNTIIRADGAKADEQPDPVVIQPIAVSDKDDISQYQGHQYPWMGVKDRATLQQMGKRNLPPMLRRRLNVPKVSKPDGGAK